MTSSSPADPLPPAEPDSDDVLMARHGISREPAHRYHYKDWRYSRLADAVAQARRDVRNA